jgi:hypothetical protein
MFEGRTHSISRDIGECFAELCSIADTDAAKSRTEHVPDMSLQDKLALWHCDPDGALEESGGIRSLASEGPDEPLGIPIANSERSETSVEETPDLPQLRIYREFLASSSAYQWLVDSLRREINLAHVEPNCMETIRQSIIQALPNARTVSRKVPADTFSVLVEMDWNVKEFLRSQDYGVPEVQALRRALTITGSAVDAQALPCAEYLRQTWPTTASSFLELLEAMLIDDSQGHHASKL